MPQCINCGFLTLWQPVDEVFKEAPEDFRNTGYYSAGSHRGISYLTHCFVKADNLTQEIATRRRENQDTETLALYYKSQSQLSELHAMAAGVYSERAPGDEISD